MLGVPLIVRGESSASSTSGRSRRGIFNREEVELLQLVAERVAVAVERARLHDEALALDELKSNFVAIASHELRTPAASVYGVLATLAERTGLDPETREMLIQVGVRAGRADASPHRAAARPLAARRAADAEEPADDRVERALSEIAAATVPEGMPVHLDVPSELVVVADPVMIERVVSNLLVNAVRYGSPPITIAVDEQDGRVRIAVEDSGEGVPEALEPYIFERFARGEDAPGSGLGLTIARAYSHAHGGELIYRRGEAGARFELTFGARRAPTSERTCAARHEARSRLLRARCDGRAAPRSTDGAPRPTGAAHSAAAAVPA